MSQHKTWVLDSLSELRVEVPYGARFSLKLLSGAAEIFGAEITNHMIDVSGDNIAVFTYTGCTLEGSGTWTNDYIPSETPPPLHLNIHACLQEIRRDRNHTQGPRVSHQSMTKPRRRLLHFFHSEEAPLVLGDDYWAR
eukprot:c19085_g2_i3.p1 GENE.c19085_g2_i3~~c19085_g2_i3.p1  ORF type:complete len:138 (+),score=9.54 c19085_g2_i3:10-423(+)